MVWVKCVAVKVNGVMVWAKCDGEGKWSDGVGKVVVVKVNGVMVWVKCV